MTSSIPQPHSPPPADPNPTLREWFVRNGPALVLLGALFLFLYIWLDWDPGDLWSIVKVVIGLGLVIFIHELGHFAVAKWCDVHVETFSIGFGPALPGCKFKYGETTYMIALFPLGGYVKMVGEGTDTEEDEEDPRSFKNKSVWQRMAIISAGVIMNVILAFVCFIIVFRGPGKKEQSAVVGKISAGSPAWKEEIPAGAWIHQIGDAQEPLFYSDLLSEVISSLEDQRLPVVYSDPPKQPQWITTSLVAERKDNRPLIGVVGAPRLEFPPKRPYRERAHPVILGRAADQAQPPFEFRDKIIGCTDPDQPDQEWTPIPDDPRDSPPGQKDYFAFDRRMRRLAGKPVVVHVRRQSGEEVSIRVPPAYHLTFGLRMQMGQISAVRQNSPKLKWQGGEPVVAGGDRRGDIIEQVVVKEPDGKTTLFWFPSKKLPVHGKPDLKDTNVRVRQIDPTRLRFELQKWVARVKEAEGQDDDLTVTLKVRRQNHDKNGDEDLPKTLRIRWDTRKKWEFAEEVPYSLEAPLSLSELGIAFQLNTTVVKGNGPLKAGDVIKEVRFWSINKKGEPEAGPWTKLETDQWANIWWAFQHYADVQKIDVRVNKSEDVLNLEATEDRSWPLAERGWVLTSDQRMKRADSIGSAVMMGLEDTYAKITQVYKVLRGIIVNRISPKNLGGPITIARVAFSIAGENFWEFIYFLGLISINLAVVNFLPIPVLDGGHMIFLIYEKIRGKPASEQVRSGATIVGLLLILSLMVFVFYLDIARLVK
jgi:regulator of sigma E protease